MWRDCHATTALNGLIMNDCAVWYWYIGLADRKKKRAFTDK